MSEQTPYEQAMALARQMARERDERFEQLKAAEAERDRAFRALRDVQETCDARAVGQTWRASYLGVANFVRAFFGEPSISRVPAGESS